jgi:hypothetical protein
MSFPERRADPSPVEFRSIGQESEAFGLATSIAYRLAGEHIVDRVGEIVDTRHWHDNNVAMTLAILSDAEESAPAVFAQIDRKKLSLDLQLS